MDHILDPIRQLLWKSKNTIFLDMFISAQLKHKLECISEKVTLDGGEFNYLIGLTYDFLNILGRKQQAGRKKQASKCTDYRLTKMTR